MEHRWVEAPWPCVQQFRVQTSVRASGALERIITGSGRKPSNFIVTQAQLGQDASQVGRQRGLKRKRLLRGRMRKRKPGGVQRLPPAAVQGSAAIKVIVHQRAAY